MNPGAIPAAERRWLVVVSAVLLLLTLAPLAVAAARTPGGHVFSGFVYEARDGNSYVAKTMEGVQGHWLYHDPYTSEQQPETLIHVPYLILGQLDRLLRLPVPLLLHLARLGLAAALLAAIYILSAECFANPGRRRLAFLLAVLGGGLGFLGIAHASLFGYHYVSLDIGVSGSSGLDSLNLAPHIVLVCLGSTWLAILWLRHTRNPSLTWLAGGVVSVVVVSSVYPQMAAMWAVIAVLAWALHPTRARLAMAASWVAAAVPYVAYGLYLRASNPVFANWPPAADVDVGDPLSFLLWGHLLMLPFAVTAVVMLLRRRAEEPKPGDEALELMAIWLGVSAALMYAPGLPPVMHRLFYATFVPFGILAAAGLWAWTAARATPTGRRRLLVYSTALMCLVGLETAAEGMTIPMLHRDDLALYFPADDTHVLEQLRSREPDGGRVVMNSYLSGLFVPAISGQTTYLGFPFETLDLERKNAESRAFYGAASAATLRTRAAELGIDYVLWGTYERGLGGTDPGAGAGWSLVASAGQARLYRVERTATALR